jgi:lactocepin
MARTSRRVGIAALVSLLGLAGLAPSASASASFDVTRVAGADRYATAASVAAGAFTAVDTVVLARGDNYAEALVGAYLGGIQALGAPVLLTTPGSLPAVTRSRIQALGAKNVILLGGTGAISTAVEQDLASSYTVTRISGTNRYDTASKVAQTTGALAPGNYNSQKTAIVVNGESFPDALAAGPIAYAQRFPILLTRRGDLPTETKDALTKLAIKHVIVIGGESAVGAQAVKDIEALSITTDKLEGGNRYATAAAVATFALTKLTGWSLSDVELATGEAFADALAAGPAAGKGLRPILLTQSATLSPDTQTWLNGRASTLTTGTVLGGAVAVSESARKAAERAGGGAGT